MRNNQFPTGIAEGDAFLGRDEEMYRLLDNVEHQRHTLLLSPRRYGKTSLAQRAIRKTHWPCVDIDLFLAIDEKAIQTRIINGAELLIAQLSDEPTHWLKTLVQFFQKANKKWTVSIKGVKLELQPDQTNDVADNILNGLQALEYLLTKMKKKAIIFIDEFQEINKLATSKVIEGSIRHFAQSAKHIVFIFSGSSRHLLIDMFGHSDNPLYDLCDWLTLDRLPETLYERYLNKVAKKIFGCCLDAAVFQKIIQLSQRHPETIYALCSGLWQYCRYRKKTPSVTDVDHAWERLVYDRLKQTRLLLSGLNTSQLKVLILIATEFTLPMTGKVSQAKTQVTSPSLVKALEALEKLDLIEKTTDFRYRVINPIIASTLNTYYEDYL